MAAQELTVLVTGACGQMGKYVVAGVVEAADMKLVGAVDPAGRGKPLDEIVPSALGDIICSGHLAAALAESQPQIMIDFTTPDVAMDNIQAALNAGVACVVGTTGFSPVDLQVVERLCKKTDTPCLIAPNFSIGANLMMKFAAEAATNFDYSREDERCTPPADARGAHRSRGVSRRAWRGERRHSRPQRQNARLCGQPGSDIRGQRRSAEDRTHYHEPGVLYSRGVGGCAQSHGPTRISLRTG